VQVPAQIDRHVAGWTCELAWQSAPGSCTWLMTSPAGERRYLKTAPDDAAVPLRGEAARLRWARASGLPVPAVLASCRAWSAEWLLTEALPGVNATDSRLAADPQALVRLLATGLRRFHQAPVAGCPFLFTADVALAQARGRVLAGLVTPGDLHPEHEHLGPEGALAELTRLRPDGEDLVVCHGDYCLPNVLISDGAVTGFVDLGELGVADRWWDLAVGAWSVTWNLGPGWEEEFLASYGVSRDDRAIAFYRLLYDLVS
jgi:aminoglycoside phosphotransferase